MKHLRIIMMALFALLALGAIASATASAEEGFLFVGGSRPADILVEGGLSTLGAKTNVICETLDDSTITLSSDKHGKGTLHWLKCTAEGLAANSKGDKVGGGEILVPVLFLICLLAGGKMAAAAEVEGSLTIEIPALGLTVEVKGQVIGEIEQTKLEEAGKHFGFRFKGEKGKQEITECKEGEAVKKHSLTGKIDAGAVETASENVVGGLLLTLGAENVIIMDK